MADIELELKRYKKQIKKLLLVKTDAAAGFLQELQNNIEDYIQTEKVTDISIVKKRFGEPEEIAKEFFAQTDIDAARKKLALKNGVIAALLAALLIWGAAVSALYIQAKNDLGGYYVDDTAISEVNAP